MAESMDNERIKARLLRIEEYGTRLRKIVPSSFAAYSKSEFVLKNAVERNLQLVSDMQFDILFLIYKGLEFRLEGNENSLLEGLKNKLGQHVAEKVGERRLLRNMLIHAYNDNTYDETAYKQAKNTEDLGEFRNAVMRILEK